MSEMWIYYIKEEGMVKEWIKVKKIFFLTFNLFKKTTGKWLIVRMYWVIVAYGSVKWMTAMSLGSLDREQLNEELTRKWVKIPACLET